MKMATQNFLKLLLLLMLMMRIVLATVADFEAEVWSKSLTFVQTLKTRFGQDFEVDVQARFAAGNWPVFSADVL